MSEQSSCDSVATSENDGSCSALLQTYAAEGACTLASDADSGAKLTSSVATPESCTVLHECCQRLPSKERGPCEAVAAGSDMASCASLESTYTTAGICGGPDDAGVDAGPRH